ncbi:hypothetical protein [Vibrio fortis]|jgi:hypothetical protein|uniref:hypothetical protein n=1 Tax=Vibrio fortis TaxID=212667 RepID=UPI0036F3477C
MGKEANLTVSNSSELEIHIAIKDKHCMHPRDLSKLNDTILAPGAQSIKARTEVKASGGCAFKSSHFVVEFRARKLPADSQSSEPWPLLGAVKVYESDNKFSIEENSNRRRLKTHVTHKKGRTTVDDITIECGPLKTK